jgi:hypothetical protein
MTVVWEELLTERIIAMVRARAEHPFRILKRQFGCANTRTAPSFALFPR